MLCICLLLHLSCYLLGLNSRSGNAGLKSTHILHLDICGQVALWKGCLSSQFTLFLSSVYDVFLLNVFHFDSGSPIMSPLCPEVRPPRCRRKLDEHIFFFLNWSTRSQAARKVLPLKALSDVAVEGPVAPLQFFLKQKGGTMKHEEGC